MNAPTTARDAAVKVLMADFADLLERLERAQREHGELQDTQRLCHTELDADLEQLGGLVQGVRADLAKAGEAGRGMVAAARRWRMPPPASRRVLSAPPGARAARRPGRAGVSAAWPCCSSWC